MVPVSTVLELTASEARWRTMPLIVLLLEVLASLQFLKKVNDRRMPVWPAFWRGESGMALGGYEVETAGRT